MVKCSKCEFETTSEKGLQIHNARKHNRYEKEKYPRSCDVCEEMFGSYRDMKKHMTIHSYKRTSYDCRCEECDFVCETSYTMDVHVGEKHRENIECGLCECTLDGQEELDTDLVTCEVYQCDDSECKERVKTISDIKKHLLEVHGHSMQVLHLKMNRSESKLVDSKGHWSNNL